MTDTAPAEVGLVLYPGVQLAAVHGLTDLFGVANNLAARRNGSRPGAVIRVTHWQPDALTGEIVPVHAPP